MEDCGSRLTRGRRTNGTDPGLVMRRKYDPTGSNNSYTKSCVGDSNLCSLLSGYSRLGGDRLLTSSDDDER